MRADAWRRAPAKPDGEKSEKGWPRLMLSWRGAGMLALLAAAVGLGLALRPEPRPVPMAQAAPLAPDFSLPVAMSGGLHTMSGGQLSLRALRGHPVLLNFFNSTCGPCLDELPVLRQTVKTYGNGSRGVVVLGVATLGDTAGADHRLAAAAHLTFPMVIDNQVATWQYDVTGLPTSFFVDAQGRLQGEQIGPLDRQTVRNGLAQAGAIQCANCAHVEPLGQVATTATGAGALAPAPAGSSHTLTADLVFPKPMAASPFALRDQRGRIITPRSLRGKVVALTFISARCTEQCPLMGRTLSLARQQLGHAAARLAIVAISVDPEQDTPRATRQFAADSAWQGMEWHYLTAPRAVLARVWSSYGIAVPKPAPIFKPGQEIVHQTGLYMLDTQGRVRAYFDVPLLAPRVAAAVQALLAGA